MRTEKSVEWAVRRASTGLNAQGDEAVTGWKERCRKVLKGRGKEGKEETLSPYGVRESCCPSLNLPYLKPYLTAP